LSSPPRRSTPPTWTTMVPPEPSQWPAVALAMPDLWPEYPARTWPAWVDFADQTNWMIKAPFRDPRISSLAGARVQCVSLRILDTTPPKNSVFLQGARSSRSWASREPAAGGQAGLLCDCGGSGLRLLQHFSSAIAARNKSPARRACFPRLDRHAGMAYRENRSAQCFAFHSSCARRSESAGSSICV
jgi:hypothetical protein